MIVTTHSSQMPRESKQYQDCRFHDWIMTHPTESPSHPPTVAKHPPPTLRHLLIERVQAAREMAAEWVEELQGQEEDLQSEEDEDQDPNDGNEKLDDPKYD